MSLSSNWNRTLGSLPRNLGSNPNEDAKKEKSMYHKEIMLRLLNNNHEAYYIGGYVRDYLLGKPSNDIDIVTSARPDEILEVFKDKNTNAVGKSFGVVIVEDIEVATFRTDNYFGLSDKNVEVKYSDSLEEDTERRDLTINAIAMDIDNKIIDFHNGVDDLALNIIRFIGDPDKRIFEDPNRILRSLRFLALLDGKMDDDSFNALTRNSHLLRHVARERIGKEIEKTISTVKRASKFFIYLHSINGLKYVLPSLEACVAVEQNKFHSETLFMHQMFAGDSVTCDNPVIKLTAYLHDIGKVDTKKFDNMKKDFTFHNHENSGATKIRADLENIRIKNDVIKPIVGLVRYHMRRADSAKAARKLLVVLHESGLHYTEYIRIKFADRAGKPKKEQPTRQTMRNMLFYFREVLNKKEPFNLKMLKVDGEDVMTYLYIDPCREVGMVLEFLFNSVLENPLLNKREVLVDALKELKKEKDESETKYLMRITGAE